MPSNYTHFSFAFTLNSPAEAEYLETILQAADDYEEDATAKNTVDDIFGEDYEDYGTLGFNYQISGDSGKQTMWIYDSDGEGNVDFAVSLVQTYLAKFNPTGIIAFEYAQTCSSPRVGEFGGGAVVVTADDEQWENTNSWVSRTVAQIIKDNPKLAQSKNP
jgi:hypothetical protein